MNAAKVRDQLRRAATEAIEAFLERHPGETVTAIALDCNADEVEVLMSIDTGKAGKRGPGDYTHPGIDVSDRLAWDGLVAEHDKLVARCSRAEERGDAKVWDPIYAWIAEFLESA